MISNAVNNVFFETPILFLVFNRPEYTQQVFDQIREICPNQLFVAADGPRGGVVGEAEQCQSVIEIVNKIDWHCEVKTLFRTQNLGCGRAVSSAISWFFDHVEYGIILEDDCLPDLSFFYFCKNLLERYKDDKSIMMVSGSNLLGDEHGNLNTYYFTKYYEIWGWATWRRAWQSYDFKISTWETDYWYEDLLKFFKNKKIANYWKNNFDLIKQGRIDTWDYQWCYNCILNHGLCIIPGRNLISNVGIKGVHSNAFTQGIHFYPRRSIGVQELRHPKNAIVNWGLTLNFYKKVTVSQVDCVVKKYFRVIREKIKKWFRYCPKTTG